MTSRNVKMFFSDEEDLRAFMDFADYLGKITMAEKLSLYRELYGDHYEYWG